jgi:hypothetical protein
MRLLRFTLAYFVGLVDTYESFQLGCCSIPIQSLVNKDFIHRLVSL